MLPITAAKLLYDKSPGSEKGTVGRVVCWVVSLFRIVRYSTVVWPSQLPSVLFFFLPSAFTSFHGHVPQARTRLGRGLQVRIFFSVFVCNVEMLCCVCVTQWRKYAEQIGLS